MEPTLNSYGVNDRHGKEGTTPIDLNDSDIVDDSVDHQMALLEDKWERRFRRHENRWTKMVRYWNYGWAIIAALALLDLIGISICLITLVSRGT